MQSFIFSFDLIFIHIYLSNEIFNHLKILTNTFCVVNLSSNYKFTNIPSKSFVRGFGVLGFWGFFKHGVI